MGEVYRAIDTRLGRDVAVKVIHPRFAADGEQLRRFEQEARAASQLNHPNILVVHDVGAHEGSPYIVSEFLDGESLRDKLGSSLPPKKAVEYAVQVANGLAAAHEKGIVHRDLKPENLFVTKDGRVKILDFGVAKLTQPAIPSISLTEAPTAAPATDAGVVLGTVGYMSPEQVLGKPLDSRTDLFSLGVVLYEMLSGRRPFQRQTAPETMAAILREDPPELSGTNQPIPPGLGRIVRHCLEKEPSDRFQSARDVAFDLESLSQTTTAGTAPIRTEGRKRRLAVAALGIALLAATASGFFTWGERTGKAPWPTFKRITFKRGAVGAARFTPDYQSVVYSAAWEGKSAELFVQRLASADARPLGVSGAVVGTAGGDVAIVRSGTLAQLPLEGGTPRELRKDIDEAAWDPGGTRFAVVRSENGRQRLEYPIGRVFVESKGLEGISAPRISPDGKRVAFIFWPSAATDQAGDICVVDESGGKRTLSRGWKGAWATCWSADGKEVWFSATKEGTSPAIHAVSLSGKERLVARLPGRVLLRDIARDGRLLLTHGPNRRFELRGRMAGDAAERDLSYLDGTMVPMLAPDGTQMLLQEWGEGGGAESSTYHWRMDGSTPKRLGDGAPVSVSPDWTTVLVLKGVGDKKELQLVPIGAGEPTALPRGPIHDFVWGAWHPDGKRIVVTGSDAEGHMQLFLQGLDGSPPRPFARVERRIYPLLPFSRDGRFIAAGGRSDAPWVLHPIDGGEPRPIPFLASNDTPLVFSDDGRSLIVAEHAPGTHEASVPAHVLRLDLETGKRETLLELAPPDRAGVGRVLAGVFITPNGRFYAYGYARNLSDLYVVEGLR